ncbi:MAG: metallophosphoesterase family protein [Moorellales bacterium]
MPRSWAVDLLAGVLGALLAVNLFGYTGFKVGVFEVQAQIRLPARPQTQIVLPPVGEVSAVTHVAPLTLRFTLTSIDFDSLLQLLRAAPHKDPASLTREFRQELVAPLWRYGLRILALAVLGAAGTMLIARRRQWQAYLRAGGAGVAVVGVLLGLAGLTFDQSAFAAPQYRGALRHAPWVAALVQEAATDLERLNQQMEVVGRNFAQLSQRLRGLGPAEPLEDALRVVLVSDIHNNPAAYELLAEAVASFQPQAVLDTGDITDLGTELEGQLLGRLRQLRVPYYFIPGNHDSPTVVKVMADIPGVRVLRREVVSVGGPRILGFADPAAFTTARVAANREELARAAEELARLVASEVPPPEAVAVHNPALARDLAGKVPVVLFGHTHRQEIEIREGTLFISAGSTGAEGIRGLVGTEPGTYSLAVLYWKPGDTGWYLAAVDLIRVPAGEHRFSLERRLFSPPEKQELSPEGG